MNETCNKVDIKIANAIFMQFAILTIQYLFLYYFYPGEDSNGVIVKLLSKIIAGIIFLSALKEVIFRELKLIIIIYCSLIVIICFNIILFPKNLNEIKSFIFDVFFICLPCFIYSYSLDDYNAVNKVFINVGNVIFTVGFFISLLGITNIINIGTYSMPLSYYMLIPSLSYLKKFLSEFSIKYLSLFLLSVISILLIGSRGPILSIAIYGMFYLLNNIRYKTEPKKIALYVIFILVILIFIVFFKDILNIINDFLKSINIYSRTIDILLMDKIHLSGRENLYTEAFKLIKNHSILGIGIGGDRYYLKMYVHNLFLEVILSFGVLIGSYISILLIGLSIKAIFFLKSEESNLILILFCLSVVPLMFSGSYLTDTWLWIFLGLTTNLVCKNGSIRDNSDKNI